MIQTEDITELVAALAAAQAEFEVIGKNATNPYYGSTYADLPAIVAASREICLNHGLVITQWPDFDGEHDLLTTLLVHDPSGQSIESSMRLYAENSQGLGSAITYCRRYAYVSALGLVTDDDDDGNESVGASRKTINEVRQSTGQPPVSEPTVTRQGSYEAPSVKEQVGNVANKARQAKASSDTPKVSKNPDSALTEAQGRAIWGVATKGLDITELELAQLVLQRDVVTKTDSKGHKILQVTKSEASKIIETGKEWERDGIPAEYLGLDEPDPDSEPF